MYEEGLTCELPPSDLLAPWGPGWYVVAADRAAEAGPFRSRDDALTWGEHLEDNGYGVHPGPYSPHHSAEPLVIGEPVRGRLCRAAPRRPDRRRLSLSA